VKESGVFPVQDSGTTTVMTAIAQAKGLGDFQPSKVYIYRNDEQGVRHEIEVDLKSIKKRKSPDVTLQARDILYVPDNTRKKAASDWLDRLAGFGSTTATGVLVYRR
jgi:protein involved in polysaccharide export with SLBB domain